MLSGDFTAAAAAFENLGQTATHPFDRGLALELARLCQTWQQRGLVFVRRQDIGESGISAKAVDERTSDEIVSLYTASVFYGLGTGGWIAAQTEPTTVGGTILPSLALAGAAAGGVALLDSGRPMHYGVPQSIVAGMELGLYEGMTWSFWNQAHVRYSEEWSGKTVASVIWGTTTAGALAGGLVGNARGTTPGRASFVGSAGLWASAVSGLTVAALSKEDNRQDDNALLAAALGLNAGAIGAMVAAGSVSPTTARVRYMDLGGIAGGLVLGGLYLSAAGSDPNGQRMAGMTAAGVTGGLVTGWILTRKMAPDLGAQRQARSTAPTMEIHPAILPMKNGMGFGFQGML